MDLAHEDLESLGAVLKLFLVLKSLSLLLLGEAAVPSVLVLNEGREES